VNAGEIARTAVAEIRGHKLRSGLTLLGIILGTLSIVVMTSFLDGVVAMLWEGFADLGYDGVLIVAGREPRDPGEQVLFARSAGLQPSDVDLLLARASRLSAVAPLALSQEIVRRGGVERQVRVVGTTAAYPVVRNRKLAAGRFLTPRDEQTFDRVCVLGHRLARRLFGGDDPVGQRVRIGGREFRVVGVAARLGNQFVDSDEFIEEMEGLYVPLATLRKFYTGERAALELLAIKTGEVERLGDVEAEIRASLALAHHGAQDFRVENVAEQVLRERQEVDKVVGSWKIVLGSLAAISLVVGGIGLLSVMLISIGERLYEIGLRKALGASDGAVFVQFLMEAVSLAFVGGALGAAGGVALTKAVGSFFPSGLPIRFGGLALAIGISVVLGAVYGVYPALKAGRMAPVESLRSVA
jgi:putative ABC transport system permease protein